MKNVSKRSAATAILLTTAILTTACGSGNNGNAASPSSSSAGASASSPEASSAAPSGPIEITAYDKPHADDPHKALIEKLFAEFEAKYPNIKVTHVEATSEKEREQFMTAVAGGQQPDIYMSAYPDMASYIAQGIPADITDMWNKYADKDKFLPASLNAATVDGKIYGVPNTMYVTGFMYNKKMFSDAGIDPAVALKDWNSFAEAAQKLTDPAKGTYGNAILGMDWADWYFEYYVWQAGGDLTEQEPDGTAKLTFTSDAAVQALQYYKDLKWKYKVTQKNVVQSLDDNQKDFATGHAATFAASSDSISIMVGKGMDINDIGFTAMPAGPAGKSPSQVGGDYFILNPKASKEKQEAAFTYATFFSSKEAKDEQYQFDKENGVFPNLLCVRTDIDMSQYVDGLPADLVAGVQNATKETHLEYFLKASLTPYVVKAVQKVLLDPNADPKTELQKAQDLAQKEVIDKYNADLKK